MKWRQRLILTAIALGICLVLTVFLVENDGIGLGRNSFRKDQISVGESEKLKKNMDIYPGKLRKRGYDFISLRRELQGKSRSADQDQDDSQKKTGGLFDDHDWLADLDSEQQKLFADLISKISPDETMLNKVLKAAYLIVSENLGSDNNDLHLSVKETDLEQIKDFLSSNGLLKSGDKSALNDNSYNKEQNVPKRPAKVIVSPEELDLLRNLKPRDVRYTGHEQHQMRKKPRKLRLNKSKLLSEWDGKELADHWKRFYTSISSTEMFPNPSESSIADDIAHNLASQEIIGVENMDGGTQIKLLFYFKDGGKAVFKPMRVTREKETDENIFYWRDYERATAEVAAYHLDRVLDMRRTSPCVSRIVNVTSDLWRLADRDLAKTFFVSPGNNVCFYGDCKYYCDTGHPVCGSPDVLDGSLCAWLPDVPRYRVKSPWRRSYSKTKLAEWEEDDNYCEKIKIKAPYNKGRRLLDVMDLETFDFLMYNMDRHHLETFDEFGNNSFLINLDNGRGFGTHSADELSIFAPVYQCCLFRYSMLQKLLNFHQGPVHLGEALKRSLRTEAIHPVLVDEHYEAIDRRVNVTLKAVAECVQNHGAGKVVFNDGF